MSVSYCSNLSLSLFPSLGLSHPYTYAHTCARIHVRARLYRLYLRTPVLYTHVRVGSCRRGKIAYRNNKSYVVQRATINTQSKNYITRDGTIDNSCLHGTISLWSQNGWMTIWRKTNDEKQKRKNNSDNKIRKTDCLKQRRSSLKFSACHFQFLWLDFFVVPAF